jgi:hypothetical protein
LLLQDLADDFSAGIERGQSVAFLEDVAEARQRRILDFGQLFPDFGGRDLEGLGNDGSRLVGVCLHERETIHRAANQFTYFIETNVDARRNEAQSRLHTPWCEWFAERTIDVRDMGARYGREA